MMAPARNMWSISSVHNTDDLAMVAQDIWYAGTGLTSEVSASCIQTWVTLSTTIKGSVSLTAQTILHLEWMALRAQVT